jgi:hypothetical protein
MQALNTDSVIKDTPSTEEEVRQDKMLLSFVIPVIDLSERNSLADNSLSSSVKQKLPDSDLPLDDILQNEYIVEFWLSPVNYEGYKMSKNKIILFGIELPDAVKLYRVNDVLYMNHLKSYYRLEITSEFKPYVRVKETDLPTALK